jgi:V8-like Glu-specific endopeptidase
MIKIGVVLLLLIFYSSEIFGQGSPIDTVKADRTDRYPEKSTCQLIVKRRTIKTLWLWKITNQSTGFFIDSNLVVTNAHNLYSSFWSKVTDIEVNRGRNKDDFPFKRDSINGSKNIKNHVRVSENYRFVMSSEKRARYDYAVLYVSPKVKPDSVLSLKPSASLFYNGRKIEVLGYPGVSKSGSELYSSKGTIKNENKWNVYYNVYTETGSSGSPVLILEAGKHHVIGIHAFPNKGVKITSAIIKQIEGWQVELTKYNF